MVHFAELESEDASPVQRTTAEEGGWTRESQVHRRSGTVAIRTTKACPGGESVEIKSMARGTDDRSLFRLGSGIGCGGHVRV